MATELLSPPGIKPNHPASPTAPFDGRFSFERYKGSLLKTPVDELTGLPLPIVPPDEYVNPDWHHHMHPRAELTGNQGDRPETLFEEGCIAVRSCRLQKTERSTHERQYHMIFNGPPLPTSTEEQLATIIMCMARSVPLYGLQFTGRREGEVVRLTDAQYQRLQTGGELEVRGESLMHSFLKKNVLSQDINDLNVKERILDEFIHTSDMERRRVIGHELLSLLTDKASEPVHETYAQARKNGLILPGLPPSARRFAKTLLGPMTRRDKIVRSLQGQLAA